MNLRAVRQAMVRREAIAERALARRIGSTERELVGIYRESRNNVRTALSRAYEKYAVNGVLTDAEMSRYGRMAALEKELNTAIGQANARAHKANNRLVRTQFEEAFAQRAWAVEQSLGRSLPWGKIPTRAVEAAINSPLADIAYDRLRTNSRQSIRRTLAQGMIRGESYPAMAREIGRVINGSASDAVRIARTEAHRIQNQAALYATDRMQEIGLKVRKQWISVTDDRTRDEHAEMDGVYADDDGVFTMPDGARGDAPGNIGEAHHDINCRCTYADVVEEVPEDVEGRQQEPRTVEELR